MTNDSTAAGQRPATGGGDRPEFTLTARIRAGPDYRGGVVVRVFPPRREAGYHPAQVARMIRQAADAANQRGPAPRLVVLPAGVGQLPAITLPTDDWTDDARLTVRDAIREWGLTCGQALPPDHPPVVLGLDGTVDFHGFGPWEQAVQVAVVLERQAVTHVTHKTKPRDADEAAALDLARDSATWRPAGHALARSDPVATVRGERVLMLVCHDAATFSARSRAASAPGGAADVIRGQYDALLVAPDAPRLAINMLHQLPRSARARSVTSPVFQNAHNVLAERYGARVIAVTAMHPDDTARASLRLHKHLRCDVASVDVFVTPNDP